MGRFRVIVGPIFPKPVGGNFLSQISEGDEAVGRYRTKRLDNEGLLSNHHTRRLDSLRGVCGEQARIYRSMLNKKISTTDGMRLVFVLREVRCSLEAVAAVEAAEAEAAAAAKVVQSVYAPPNISITAIPSGLHFTESGRTKLDNGEQITSDDLRPFRTLEHQPTPAQKLTALEAELIEEIKPQTPEETRRIIELSKLSIEQLATMVDDLAAHS
jgi:hypothetical protein